MSKKYIYLVGFFNGHKEGHYCIMKALTKERMWYNE